MRAASCDAIGDTTTDGFRVDLRRTTARSLVYRRDKNMDKIVRYSFQRAHNDDYQKGDKAQHMQGSPSAKAILDGAWFARHDWPMLRSSRNSIISRSRVDVLVCVSSYAIYEYMLPSSRSM